MARTALLIAIVAGIVATDASAAGGYRVRAGDSLSAIAADNGTTVATLEQLNGLSPTAPLLAGSLLELPSPTVPTLPYRVRPGDTLSAIAASRGTTVAQLDRLNGLRASAPLLAGSLLRLPAPTPTPTIVSYRIRPGDTLGGIAARMHTTVGAIAAASGIRASEPILSGATLSVPVTAPPAAARLSYTVRPGDSLSAIALRFGVSLGGLAAGNDLQLSAPLLVGTRLELPAGATPARAEGVRASIAYWSAHYGVDAHLATALAWMESGFNNEVVSAAGAVGVMQITPQTWSYVEDVLLLGARVPSTPDGNVRVGVAYLHHLLHLFAGDEHLALAAYYQGARSLQQEGELPGTEQYVDDVLALSERF